MKKILFGVEFVAYVFYVFIFFISLAPMAKSSLKLSGPGPNTGFKIFLVSYSLFILGLSSWLVYKSYKNLDSNTFWIYLLLALLCMVITTFVSYFFMI